MKCFFLLLSLFPISSAMAANLANCYREGFVRTFERRLEDLIAPSVPILLHNDIQEVVGYIGVKSKDAKILFQTLYLCTGDTFYDSISEEAENLLDWPNLKSNQIQVSHYEGLLVLNIRSIHDEAHGRLLEIKYKDYDVFFNDDPATSPYRQHPDFLQEWGMPKSIGDLYFSLPNSLLK